MKPNLLLSFVLATVAVLTGCATYDYQVSQPPTMAGVIIKDQPVVLHYDPLEYRLSRYHEHLGMTIVNPTTDRITLRADRSFVVDPRGESHPIRGRVLAPHTYSAMLLPPPAASGQTIYPTFYGPGWWVGGYPYVYNDFYGSYYGPVVTYYHIYTPYDWKWEAGPAHLHLAYNRNGKEFDHEFVILRQREK